MLGERIRQIRRAKGMTQQDLANKLKLAKSTISQYENEVNEPDNNTLQKIADLFEVSIDYLLGREFESDAYIISKEGQRIPLKQSNKKTTDLTPEELVQLEKLKHEEVAFKDFLDDPIEAKREFLQAYELFKEMKRKRDQGNKS